MLRDFIVEGAAKKENVTVETADNFLRRFLGLMFRRKLPSARALLIVPCNSVHMCFMFFAIDVIYVDRDYRVKKIVANLRPWLGLSMCRGAWAAFEFAAGEAKRLGVAVGDKIAPKTTKRGEEI